MRLTMHVGMAALCSTLAEQAQAVLIDNTEAVTLAQIDSNAHAHAHARGHDA